MKTYWDLSLKHRARAIRQARQLLVAHVVEGVIELTFSNKETQDLLEKSLNDARRNETPSEAIKFLMTDRRMRQEIDKIAVEAAIGSRYSDDSNLLKEVI